MKTLVTVLLILAVVLTFGNIVLRIFKRKKDR